MSGTKGFDFAKAWKEHRGEKSKLQFLRIAGGLVVLDGKLIPARAWLLYSDAPGTVPQVLEGRIPARPGMKGEEIAKTLRENKESKKLSPRETAGLMGLCAGEESLYALSVRRFMESLPDDDIRARAPVEKMLEAEKERLENSGLDVFRACIDEEALCCLVAAEDASWNDYKFYSIGGPGEKEPSEKDKALRTVRQQAARSYPMLAPLFSSRFTLKAALDAQAKFMIERAPIKARMDAAKANGDTEAEAAAKSEMDALAKPPALIDAMEKALTPLKTKENPDPKPIVSRAALARIQGIPFAPKGIRPDQLAMFMTELPPDWFPKKGTDWTLEEWTAFTDLAATVGVILRRLTGSKPDILFEGCGGKWVAMRDRIVKAFTDSRPPGGLEEDQLKALQDAIDWKGLESLPIHKTLGAANAVAQKLQADGLIPPATTAAAVADWIVRLTAPPRDRATIMNHCLDTADTVYTFTSKVLMPMAATLTNDGVPYLNGEHYDLADRISGKILFAGKSAVKVFETQAVFRQYRGFIEAAGAIDEDLAGITDERYRQKMLERLREEQERKKKELAMGLVGIRLDDTPDWTIPFPAVVQAPNGAYLCTLFTKDQMKDEGRGFDEELGVDGKRPPPGRGPKNADGSYGMRLCCGYDYHINNAKEGKFIYTSVRMPGELEGDGAPYHRLSLARTSFSKKNGKWVHNIGEHRGYSNGDAPEIAKEAIKWFYHQIETGNIPHGLDSMESFKKDEFIKKANNFDKIEDRAGYNWKQTYRVGKAFSAWHPVLGKSLRVPLEKMLRHPEVARLADAISPGWRINSTMRDEAVKDHEGFIHWEEMASDDPAVPSQPENAEELPRL